VQDDKDQNAEITALEKADILSDKKILALETADGA